MQISDIKTDKQTGELYYAPLDKNAIFRPKTSTSFHHSALGSRYQKPLEGSVTSHQKESMLGDQLPKKQKIAIHD